ncbi:sphingosine-1-phosphate lyase 1 [Exaiptasia diaphana]|uniref:sphinganine-1-phosphate aldolase n=1 Tax=Exaiptasia diaphana TaxID=2652724 RepID=A0A913XGL0_EXADI|nr:sphingosine-1-phosphate lyase 1 [Exaiptasia diaphana]KXJ12320.1 Sphingosine-1-phosphate lyase 1 [Exaiptasia diaphana]
MEAEPTLWEKFLAQVEPHLPEYLHWNEICWTFVSYLAEVRRYIHRKTRGMEAWEIVVNTATICFYVWITFEILRWLISWIFFQDESFISRVKKTFFRTLRRLPIIKDKINEKMQETLDDMEQMAFPLHEGQTYRLKLPSKGLKEAELSKEIDKYGEMVEIDWEAGQVSGTVYSGGKELTDILTKVYAKFAWTNPLHADIFPDVRKMEAEVVRMTISLFNGGEEACGTMTLGGTESILLACKAYRDWAYERGIKKPEIVAPNTIHAAFDKAAHYFGFKLVHVAVNPKTYTCDLKALKRAITSRTIAIAGSAPHFPHGIVDPIEDMAKLAKRYNIGMHVDACLGGFLIPFMAKAGYHLPPFDFKVDGVTSISCDTHKYGYAPKGSSVIMYHSKHLRQFQFFVAPDWPGGIYACPTIPGSRPGGIMAATWAAMMHFGESGYVECTKKIIQTREKIQKGIETTKGLYVLGDPKVSIVAFGSHDFNIYCLGTSLTERGWCLNCLQNPAAIHYCITLLTTQQGVADRFIKDIKECTAKLLNDPNAKTTGMGAIYGMAQSIPDRSMVSELACGFLDCMYNTKDPKPAQNGTK